MPRTTQQRVLFLAQTDTPEAAIQDAVPDGAEVRVVSSINGAIEALRGDAFDLVVSRQADFLALERAAQDQQASVILDSIGQGVCIVDLTGRMVWANPKMQSTPSELHDEICKACVKTFGRAESSDPQTPAFHRARRFSLTAGEDQHFEVTVTPVAGDGGAVQQVVAVVWDVTHSRRLQKKIDAIDYAGRELVRLDVETAAMTTEERIGLLEQKMLRYLHDLLHYDNFAVLLLDKKTNRLEFVIQHGMREASRDLDIFASPENNGISGYVAATSRSYICYDTLKDPRYIEGLEAARSSITVPLRLHDQVIGVLNIESEKPAAFNEDDRQFVEILARYVAIALNFLDLLIIERYESTGRVADDVSGQIAGPLNDIMTEASTLVEEYIGNDDLRHRLNVICDRVEEIRQSVKDVTNTRAGILGHHGDMVAIDPILAGKRVLVADDEEIIRDTVGGVLEKRGCIVRKARDGREAADVLAAESFDLLLADIKMPHLSGYQVFAEARDRYPSIAVVLMTGFGYDPNHSIVRARKEGLNAVLFKPFKVDQLITELHAAFGATA